MKPKTTNERQAAHRARKRKAGFVLTQYWVHPKDRERVDKYVARVNRKRI